MYRIGIAFLLILAFSCQKTTDSICDSGKELRDVAPFPIGTTEDGVVFNWQKAQGSRYFNRISSENILKMENLAPRRDSFNFWPCSWLSREAKNAGYQYLHIHPVIWHRQLPYWLANYPKNQLKNFLTDYCRQFKKAILLAESIQTTGIDVVNEALNEDGTLRSSIWMQGIGKEYILEAYRIFSELDPQYKLFYNDYNLALNPAKLDAALDLCDWLRSQGVRVDGIGMQMHINLQEPSSSDIADAFAKITNRGYLLHVSELDISINPYGKANAATSDLLDKQADKFVEVIELYRHIPAHYQYGVTVWGISDRNSWIPGEFNRFDAPLLFDQNNDKKPAYCSFLNALNQ
ncbi:MAG: hypothetical protein GC180_04350 [Bacteroidetes bacterium]|nr:hypothetical protein [Bacteroidota bacterium]